ncbi:energy-coupling factor ABC transporter ATP-binding protein [Sulfurimonas sp.]
MISLQNYSFSYDDKRIFKHINLEINKGEKLVFLGNNGSGKSTLLRLLAGLYFGDGSYELCEITVTKKSMKQLRKKVAILFQNPDSMIFNPTVFDEIAFSLRVFGMSEVEDRVHKIAKEFSLESYLEQAPLSLSGGQKQKVMLASILVYEPEFLLLDEPTSAMDPKTTGWLIDYLQDVDITTVIATHDIGFAYESAQRVIVLDEDHQFIYDGELEPLMKDLQTLERGNLIHKHRHKHKGFNHSHYHLHF